MSAPAAIEDHPLRRNRDFNLLWVGQVLSDVGGNASAIAFPLLVLATTGSPVRAGIVGAAARLPDLVLSVPAGALVDRWNQKRVMIVMDCARAAAFGSLALAVALDAVAFGHIVAVAFVEGVGYVFFDLAEGSALPKVVADRHLDAARARNSARAHTAALAGQPLGGILFGLGRAVPFVFDAVSYVVSVVMVGLIRTSFGREVAPEKERLRGEMRAGLSWFWHQPFLRATSLVSMTRSFTMTALYLVVIVIERERGASATLIGLTFCVRRSRWTCRLASRAVARAACTDAYGHRRDDVARRLTRSVPQHPPWAGDAGNRFWSDVDPQPCLVDRRRRPPAAHHAARAPGPGS
jgi:MFS family permease